jgi:hypothetical protein
MGMKFAVALGLLLLLPVMNAQEAWPFGSPRREGGRELDLWNLGLLGAKARELGRAASTTGASGGRRTGAVRDQGQDVGPQALEVVLLHPASAAAKAGLQVGDVIRGIQGASFEGGCLAPLAAQLDKAERAEKGSVTLQVARMVKGREEIIPLKVPVRGIGKASHEHKTIQRAALQFLNQRQMGDGGFAETLSGKNGAVVQTALAGLAWLSASEDPSRGPWAQAMAAARGFVLRHALDADGTPRIRNGANWDQSTWGVTHALLFLSELRLRSKSSVPASELQRLVKALEERMEDSGGYAHGPGGKNALDYLELNILTASVLSAMGLAHAAGAAVELPRMQRVMAYCEASASSDGGVGYSTGAGQKGHGNIGRTAAALLGARRFGWSDTPFALKMKSYVERNAADVMGGHASLMQHVLLSGVAAAALGGEVSQRWWARAERDLTLARAPDGSLQPRPWHESLSMDSNSDVSVGEVWSTACWAVVLGADSKRSAGPGFPGWCGLTSPQR